MIHYNLRNSQQFGGGFTDLFILGQFRKWNATTKTWGSDFTGVAETGVKTDSTTGTTTTWNLIQVTDATVVSATQGAGSLYIPIFPFGMIVTKYPFSNTADNPKLDLGVANTVTASTSLIAGTATDLELKDRIALPAAAAVPLAPSTASQWLTATLTNVAGTVDALVTNTSNPAGTGAEIWIFAALASYREWVKNRD